MLVSNSFGLIGLWLLLTTCRLGSAQNTPTTTITTTIHIFPTGVAIQNSSIESVDPLPCAEICFLSPLSSYSYVLDLQSTNLGSVSAC